MADGATARARHRGFMDIVRIIEEEEARTRQQQSGRSSIFEPQPTPLRWPGYTADPQKFRSIAALLVTELDGWACRWGREELVDLPLSRGARSRETRPLESPAAWFRRMNYPDLLARLSR